MSQNDWISGSGWPLGETVVLTINDPANGSGIDYTDSKVTSPNTEDPNEIEAVFSLNDFDLKPGHIVTVSDGVTPKTLTVTYVEVTGKNVIADTISGVAAPGAELRVVCFCESRAVRHVTADANGNWVANFHVAGSLPDEMNISDITYGCNGHAQEIDPDGDFTLDGWSVSQPNIIARLTLNQVDADGWLPGTPLTITVEDRLTGLSPNYTDTAIVGPADTNSFTSVNFFFGDAYTLKSGDVVTVTGDNITRTTTVADIHVTNVDVENNIVSGIAGPGITNINVRLWTSPMEMQRDVEVVDGAWSANFSIASSGFGVYDIKQGDNGVIRWFEGDGDFTTDYWEALNPAISVRVNDNRVEGSQWALGSTVTITIDDPTTADDPAPATVGVGVAPWDANQTWFEYYPDGYTLKPGDIITQTDEILTKQLVVSGFMITNVNLDTDIVSGIAEPNQIVNVWTCWQNDPCISRDETANENGDWSASFAIAGEQDWEQEIANLRPGSWIDSSVNDEDGDSTMFGWSVLSYTLHAVPTHPEVHGHDWPAGDVVTLSIDGDTNPGNGVLYTQTRNADDDPWCGSPCFDLSGVFDLQVGQYVTMSDGNVSKTVQVSNLAITEVDHANDIISGIAAPGSRVAVNIWSQDGLARYVTTDSTGHWVADFSTFGDEDFEQFTTDIAYGDNGRAIQLNPDDTDDGTLEYWNIDWVAPPSVPVVFAISSAIDISVPIATVDNISVLNTMNDSLFRLDQKNVLQPLGATGYTISSDGLTYTISLRPGALWSDGQLVTAQDYATGILRVLDPTVGSDYGFILFPIKNARAFSEGAITDPSLVGVKALDSLTLEITLEQPTSHFSYILASPVVLPAPTDVIATYGDTWTQPGHHVSNGLYRLVEYDAGHILVEKNPLYNGPMEAHFDQIGFDVISDSNQQIAAYKDGIVDVLLGTPVQSIMDDPALHKDLTVLPSPGIQYIGLSAQVFPTDDPLVRKALASAVNRQILIDDILNTSWRPEATGVIPPELPGYQGSEAGYSYNPDQAREYLKDAGYPGGAGFPALKLLAIPSNTAILEEIARQWESVLGITVDIEYVAPGERMSMLAGCRANPSSCAYNGYLHGWVIDYPDAYNFINDLLHPDSPYNYTQWDNPAYRNLIDLAVSELDPAQRISYLQQAQQLIVKDEAAIIPLVYLDGAMVIRPGIFPYYSSAYFTNLAYWSNVDPANDGMTAVEIGSDGGVISTENNTVSVDVPANALQEDVTLSVTDLGGNYQITVVEENLSVLTSYSVQPHGLQFDVPVTLTFAWQDANNDGVVDGTTKLESNIFLVKDGEPITPACGVNPECDMDNNSLSVQVASLSRFELVVPSDTTGPTIAWLGNIQDGDTFFFGFVPPVPACTASDDISGVEGGCTVSGYDTSIGTHTLTATAQDKSGNQSIETRSYTVSGWKLKGFYQPVDMNGVYNLVKGGSTVPLKFEVFAGLTELTTTTSIKSLAYAETACAANAITDEIELTVTGDTSLHYDTASGQFIYNWKTPKNSGKCYRVNLVTQDGSFLSAYFRLK